MRCPNCGAELVHDASTNICKCYECLMTYTKQQLTDRRYKEEEAE